MSPPTRNPSTSQFQVNENLDLEQDLEEGLLNIAPIHPRIMNNPSLLLVNLAMSDCKVRWTDEMFHRSQPSDRIAVVTRPSKVDANIPNYWILGLLVNNQLGLMNIQQLITHEVIFFAVTMCDEQRLAAAIDDRVTDRNTPK